MHLYLAQLIVLLNVENGLTDVTNPEKKLIDYLFETYNPNARPSTGITNAVNLTYDIALRQMLDMDEKQQIMTTNVWIRHYWYDPYLVWNPTNWSDITYVSVNPKNIWKPDITLYNNAEREFQGFDNFGKTRVNIYNNGHVVWLVPVILRSECKLHMNYFPFDTQECPLVFGSWTYDGGAMDFHPKNPSGDMTSFSPSGEFIIEGLKATRVSTLYTCCPNPYVTITYTIQLHRRVKFYFFNLIIPGILIALLSCFSFFLPPLSGERTGLIITNFLSLSVYVLMVSDSVPPSSESVPLLVRFYTIMITEIALALIFNCIVIPLAAKNVPVPTLVKTIFLKNISRLVLCANNNNNNKESRDEEFLKSNNNTDDLFNNGNITFVKENKKLFNGTHSADPIFNGNHPNIPESAIILRQQNNKFIDTDSNYSEETLFEKKTLHYLSKMNDYLKDEKNTQSNREEWETLINVLDRCFFTFFSAIIIISSIVLVLEAPDIKV